jgi:DNA-binding response OmpR family regulator
MNAYALIATGNIEKARQYQQALQTAGFVVETVRTGARAQVQLAFTTPNLIVLDMVLPDMTGEVVLRQVLAHRRLDNAVVFLLSAVGSSVARLSRAQTYALAQSADPAGLASLALDACQQSV